MIRRWLLWIAALALLALPVAYSWRMRELAGEGWLYGTYFQNAIGNSLATMVGVAAGLPIALELQRYGEATSDRRRLLAAQHEADRRRDGVERRLRLELETSIPSLHELANGEILTVHVRTGEWMALGATGAFEAIGDFPPLGACADAYEAVAVVNMLLDRWLMSVGTGVGRAELELLVRNAGADALGACERAVAALLSRPPSGTQAEVRD